MARIYYFTMTQLDIAVGVSRVHNADILLDLASFLFFTFHVTDFFLILLLIIIL